MTVSIGTIRDLIDHHYTLTAWCSACRHNYAFDLQKRGERLGYDHSTLRDDLTPKLKCSKCRIGLILSYDDPRQRAGKHPR
jgi:hypothetical protein